MTSPFSRRIRRTDRPRARGAAVVAFLGLASVAGPLPAQEVRGTAVEAGSGAPVSGAFVSLVPADSGAVVASALTGPDGAYVLHAFTEGRYRLRVERIGYATWRSGVFRAGPGRTVTRRLAVSVRPVAVRGLRVAVDSRCTGLGAGAGARLAAAWEEVRKALEVTRWTEEQATVRLELGRRARTLHPESGRVLDEETGSSSKRSWRSFVSAPARELAERGWVRRDGDAWVYFAPDAEVLLSESFVAGHCFSLAEGPADPGVVGRQDAKAPEGGDGWIGIRFRPADRPDRPDVEGVLWLDAGSAELRRLDFSYVGRDLPLPEHPGGGSVEFARLPTGHWFVRRWRLRMPVVGTGAGLRMRGANAGPLFRRMETRGLAAVREVGGEVERVRLGGGDVIELAARGSVSGAVREADGSPAAGADVRLRGTEHRGRAGPDGAFRFDLVAPGAYTAEARHPEAATWGLSPATAAVEVRAEETARVGLALPSVDEALAARCEEADPEAAAGRARADGTLAGVVRDAGSDRPVRGAEVWIVRMEWRFRERPWVAQVQEDWSRRVVETDSAGAYVACGIGADEAVVVQANSPEAASDTVRVRMPPEGFRRLDLRVSPDHGPMAGVGMAGRPAAGDPAALANPPEGRAAGAATLTGTVRSSADGRAVSGARVRLLGDAGEAVTGAEGRFVIPEVGPGSHRLVTEYVGAVSDTVPVHLEGGTVQVVSLGLETRPVPLPELRVAVERSLRDPRLAGFYERMARGLGDFVTREDLERVDVIGAFRRIPSVQVEQCITASGLRHGGCWELRIARGAGLSTHCPPRVFLNGHLLDPGTGDERIGEGPMTRLQGLPRDMIEGIEVHRGPGTAPPTYGGGDSACGVVLVWSRGR